MSPVRPALLTLVCGMLTTQPQTISFPTRDGGRVCADLYGQGARAVVLVHGGRFNKESWREQAMILASRGFRVLAIDWRGFGCSTGPGQAAMFTAPLENDVLAAVDYLTAHGPNGVSSRREPRRWCGRGCVNQRSDGRHRSHRLSRVGPKSPRRPTEVADPLYRRAVRQQRTRSAASGDSRSVRQGAATEVARRLGWHPTELSALKRAELEALERPSDRWNKRRVNTVAIQW